MKTIVLSAGHGGRDSGAVGNGLKESDCNLKITLACRDYLNKNYSGHKLVLPRDRDIYVSLPARRDITVQVDADLYVSYHNNAANNPDGTPNPNGRGFETFTNSGPLYETTLAYQKILHDTVYSYLRGFNVVNRGPKRANHYVTKMMPCPTVLMEYLFVTSPSDAVLLKRPDVLQRLGEQTGEGIARALKLPEAMQPQPPQTDVWFRVIAGSYRQRENADATLMKLKRDGYDAFIEGK